METETLTTQSSPDWIGLWARLSYDATGVVGRDNFQSESEDEFIKNTTLMDNNRNPFFDERSFNYGRLSRCSGKGQVNRNYCWLSRLRSRYVSLVRIDLEFG